MLRILLGVINAFHDRIVVLAHFKGHSLTIDNLMNGVYLCTDTFIALIHLPVKSIMQPTRSGSDFPQRHAMLRNPHPTAYNLYTLMPCYQ